jgi:hypothetical protein
MQVLTMSILGFALAAAAAAPAGARGWDIPDAAAARAKAKRTLFVVLTDAAQPRGNSGRCRVDFIVLGAEPRGPLPGSPTGSWVPCASHPRWAPEGRWTPMASLAEGSFWRLHLSGDGEPLDLERLNAASAPLEVSAREADRRQLWRLIHAGSGDSLLVDTDDVEVAGDRRMGWVKRNLAKVDNRRIVQVLTRVEYDCAARTQTLHAWYARTASDGVDSGGAIPAEARRAVPVDPKTHAARAMALLCAPRQAPRS